MGQEKDMVRIFNFEQYHGKRQVGSTKIRVHNLIKYWPEAELYKYGEKPDVLIFQKVYMTQDYIFPKYFKGLKILDICDPDWLDGTLIKNTVDAMDAITCPTEPIAEFIRQLTDKPVKVIKDRFDLSDAPTFCKQHTGKIKEAVWFGYAHNAETLQRSGSVYSLERRNINLTVISDRDPQVWKFASNPEKYKKRYAFIKYSEDKIWDQLVKFDVAIVLKGDRPKDRFKSENRTIRAWLSGLPTPQTAEDMEKLDNPTYRAKVAQKLYNKAVADYDVKKSVSEYKELIDELRNPNSNNRR